MPVSQLKIFNDMVQHIGSSKSVVEAASRSWQQLELVLFLFQENAADLFPHSVQRGTLRSKDEIAVSLRANLPDQTKIPTAGELPNHLRQLATDLKLFVDRLNKLPEGKHHWLNSTITILASNLKYWASCLTQYTGLSVVVITPCLMSKRGFSRPIQTSGSPAVPS